MAEKPLLQIITASTRPGRKGGAVAAWFADAARAHGAFEIEEIDLAEIGLPMFDETNHPVLGNYEHGHTKRWSDTVKRADAFVFVTPEYNFVAPPSLVNAVDYLSKEWNYKAVGFVSYGGLSGGTRAVQSAKQLVTTVRMYPVYEAVAIPFFTEQLGEDGSFKPTERNVQAATAMLDELVKVDGALRGLRA